jgi:alpha-beta hydrolase superfamily lysophospholipase
VASRVHKWEHPRPVVQAGVEAAALRRLPAPHHGAATALELLRVCRELQGRFEEVDLPFLVVHGEENTVCDPASVEELHRRAGSSDKTLRIYPGMWHQMVGESEENVEMVFDEIVAWLKDRAANAGEQSQQEYFGHARPVWNGCHGRFLSLPYEFCSNKTVLISCPK